MRVLVTAYSCEPHKGSEPGAGWNWVRQIATHYECHLITRENNVAAIEEAAREQGLDGLTVHGYDLPRWARFWKRGQRGSSLYYYLWQLGFVRLAKRLDRKLDFDVVHHVTYVANYLPSGLAFLGKPFVWGPVGQHPRIPAALIPERSLSLRITEACKAGLKWAFRYLDPLFRKTLRSSDLILSLSRPFEDSLDDASSKKLLAYSAVGVEAAEPLPQEDRTQESFEVLYSGRLVDLKGVRLALAAFAEFASEVPSARFRLLGKGPLKRALVQMAEDLGVAERVVFEGEVSHDDALAAMRDADVFLFPSFEGAGMVVIEAMAACTPVLCLDFGGPGRMVSDDRGLRVSVGESIEETVHSLAGGLRLLHRDAGLRERINRAGLEWVQSHMTWEAKGKRLEGFYTRAIQHRKQQAA